MKRFLVVTALIAGGVLLGACSKPQKNTTAPPAPTIASPKTMTSPHALTGSHAMTAAKPMTASTPGTAEPAKPETGSAPAPSTGGG